MSTPVPNGEPPASWRTDRVRQRGSFEGADHGGPVSGFVVDAASSEGPGLHLHPYAETFVVLLLAGSERSADRRRAAAGPGTRARWGGVPLPA